MAKVIVMNEYNEYKKETRDEVIANDCVEFQSRNFTHQTKYIIETEIADKNATHKGPDGQIINDWGYTRVYDATQCPKNRGVCFAERTYPQSAQVLFYYASKKEYAVAMHKCLRTLLNKGYTIEEVKTNRGIIRKIASELKKHSNDKAYKSQVSVKEKILNDMREHSSKTEEELQKEASKIRNILMQDEVKDQRSILGDIVITPYNVKTTQKVRRSKEREKDFITTVTDLTRNETVYSFHSANKPQAKRMHKTICDIMQKRGPLIVYYPVKDNFIPRKKGIHRATSENSLENNR